MEPRRVATEPQAGVMEQRETATEASVLHDPLRVVNIGLESFAEDLRAQNVRVIQLDWRPPAGGDARLASLLASLDDED